VLTDEIKGKLEGGGAIADVGCGQGLAACILAKAFPKATVKGFDYSESSIVSAKSRAAGLGNVSFETVGAEAFGNDGEFDVACFLDCFHDMSVAGAAAKRAFVATKPDGICFLIEPMAAEIDSVKCQLALPTTQMFSAFSCQVCLCCSSCNDGDALGTLCPTSKHEELFKAAGFKSLESVTSPINGQGFRLLVAKKEGVCSPATGSVADDNAKQKLDISMKIEA